MKTLLYCCSLLLLSACASSVTGTLTDARGYQHGLTAGGNFTFADYSAKLGGLPACVVKADGQAVYLAMPSAELSRLAAEKVTVRGKFFKEGRILYPTKIKVWENGRWKSFDWKPAR